jgi:hypothetical protein
MARLFFGIGKGFKSSTGFKAPTIPISYNSQIFRPKFSSSVAQFIRKTSATGYTPWPFGDEGTGGGVTSASITETLTAIEASQNILTAVASETEAASSNDIVNSTIITQSNEAESATATESQSSTASLIVNESESANAIDVPAFEAAVIHTVDIVENVTSIENEDSSILTSSTESESANAQDSLDSIKLALSTIEESVTAEDVINSSYAVIKLSNGIRLVHRMPPQENDLRVKIGTTTFGIPVVSASNDRSGSFRFKYNNIVYALKQAA